jgi:hypothetical protein
MTEFDRADALHAARRAGLTKRCTITVWFPLEPGGTMRQDGW